MDYSKGKDAAVFVVIDNEGTPEDHEVEGVNNLSVTIGGEEADVTAFGDEWSNIVKTVGNLEVTFSGFYDSGDTYWTSLMTASSTRTPIALKVYIHKSGTNDYHIAFDAYVDVTVSAEPKGMLTAEVTAKLASGAPLFNPAE